MPAAGYANKLWTPHAPSPLGGLAKGMIFAYCPKFPGDKHQDLVTRKFPTVSGIDSGDWRVRKFGGGFFFQAAADSLDYGDRLDMDFVAARGYSVFALMGDLSSSGSVQALISKKASAAGNGWYVGKGVGNQLRMVHNGTAVLGTGQGPALGDTITAWVWDGANARMYQAPEAWSSNASFALATKTTASLTAVPTSAGQPVRIGSMADGLLGCLSSIQLIYVWARAISDREFQILATDPYFLLRPELHRRVGYFPIIVSEGIPDFLGPTSSIYAPVVTAQSTPGAIGPVASVGSPAVVAVSTAGIISGTQVFAPTGGVTESTPTFISATVVLAPSLAASSTTVLLGPGSQTFAPTVSAASTLAFLASGAVLFAPTTSISSTLGMVAAGSVLFAPSATAASIVGFLSSTLVVSAPSMDAASSPATLGPISDVYAPALAASSTVGIIGPVSRVFGIPEEGAMPEAIGAGTVVYAPEGFLERFWRRGTLALVRSRAKSIPGKTGLARDSASR